MSCRIREAVSLDCMSSFCFGWPSVVLEAPSAIFRDLREAARRFPSGARRIDNPINRRRMAEMSARIEAARAFLHTAAAMADAARAPSLMPYIQAKVVCSELAVWATQELMTMFGGTAFARELPFERYFRDARAGVVMGLANDQAYETIGDILFPPDAAG